MNIAVTTAPITGRPDTPDATGADIAASSTGDRLASARATHADATANAQQAQRRADTAAAAHRTATAEKAALLARAAAGEAVVTADLTRAGIDVAMARDAMDLATTIARGAGTIAERAHIAALRVEADHLRAGYDLAVASRIAAATVVDCAWQVLQAALEQFNDTNLDVSIASNSIRWHNSGLDAHAASNAALAGLHPSERPTALRPADVPLRPAKVMFIAPNQVDLMEDKFASLAARERSLFGIREATAEPPAHEETRLEREASERVWADAHTGKGALTFTPTVGPSSRTGNRR